jgi:hypothetical protein
MPRQQSRGLTGAMTAGEGLGPPDGRQMPVLEGWPAWFGTITGVAELMVLAVPVALLVVWGLARRRRRAGAPSGWAWRSSVAEVGIVWWTVPLVWMTMLPGSGAGVVPGRVSLVPLQDLVTDPAVQIIGNLLLFAALGSLGPVRFAALASVRRVLVIAAVASTTIEVAQYALQLDRVSSVDDVLLNAVGAGLAAVASRRWWRGRTGTPPDRSAAGRRSAARAGQRAELQSGQRPQ